MLAESVGAAGRRGTYRADASEPSHRKNRPRRTGPDPMQARGEQAHSSTRSGAGCSAS